MTSLKLSSHKQIWRELIALLIALTALFLFISLISYNPSDNSWLHSSSLLENYHNWGGFLGASLADTLFLVFGFVAYLIPLTVLLWCGSGMIQARKQYSINYLKFAFRLVGAVFFFLSSCALVQQSILHSSNFDAGGVIGIYIQEVLTPLFGFVGRTLLLIAIWLLSLTLSLHISWLYICEQIGQGSYAILKSILYLFKGLSKLKKKKIS